MLTTPLHHRTTAWAFLPSLMQGDKFINVPIDVYFPEPSSFPYFVQVRELTACCPRAIHVLALCRWRAGAALVACWRRAGGVLAAC